MSQKPELTREPVFYGWIVAGTAFVLMIVIWGTYYSFGVYFKPLSGDFGWTRAVTAGAFSTYMILHGVLAIFAGRFTDKYGPRLVIMFCVFFLALGYALTSQIHTLWQLYLFYGVIIGIGMSGSYVSPISVVTRWFEKNRGLVLGFVICGIGVGTTLFPPIAHFFIANYGWRTAYAITAVIILVLGTASTFFLKRDPRDMGLLPYGATAGTEIKPETKEATLPHPAISDDFSLHEALRTAAFWQEFIAYFLCLGCLEIIMIHLVNHATDIGIPAATAAVFLSIIGGASIAGRLAGGIIADRIGTKIAIAMAAVLQGLAVLSLLVIREPWLFYIFAALFGLGYGGWVPPFPAITGELFGMKAHGAIFGVIVFAAAMGGAIGSYGAGLIFDVTQSYAWAFVAAATASIIAGLMALLLKPPKNRTHRVMAAKADSAKPA